jgi:small neutral amino acid transporter SnatA (MarC family)
MDLAQSPVVSDTTHSASAKPKSRVMIVGIIIAVVILLILLLMIIFGKGFKGITLSEVALGATIVLVTGGVAFWLGKKTGSHLEASVKQHLESHGMMVP